MEQTDPWNVAIFSSRETPTLLLETIRAVLKADRPAAQAVIVDALVNGNAPLAAIVSKQVDTIGGMPAHSTLRIWQIAQPDKAYTFNTYVHALWPGGSPTFFVDGYAVVDPPSLSRISEALLANPSALAATCVPRMGPSARSLLRQLETRGGIQGNLYAMTTHAMYNMRNASFKLPVNIYRNDSLMNAVLCLHFDPVAHAWDKSKVIVVRDASYSYRTPSLFRLSDQRSYVKRRFRQARGLIETRAIRHHLVELKRPLRDLPATAYDMMYNWCKECPEDAWRLFRRAPLSYLAYHRMLKEGRPKWPDTPPQLVMERSTN